MKKRIKALYLSSSLLVIGFVIMVVVDWINYNPVTNSAPFHAFVLLRCVEFLPLAAVFLIAALIFRKKQKGEP